VPPQAAPRDRQQRGEPHRSSPRVNADGSTRAARIAG
jgi:hypothetical protein